MPASASGSTPNMRPTKKNQEKLSVHHPQTMLTQPKIHPEIQNLSRKNFRIFFFFFFGKSRMEKGFWTQKYSDAARR